jgi:putative heme-binding domain-containing protein
MKVYSINFATAVALVVVVLTSSVLAQNPLSVAKPESDNSVQAELKSFKLADGYEARLFADETNGVANPVCMSWDTESRLWVLCTWVYPQLKPVDKPDDKLLILEDTDGDGRADKTTVFADGLNMPTGFAIGHGGAYIAQGNDLLHLKDTNGDSKADTRKVLLTGFGTGDTHQNINSLTWSPGGELLFCQGLHAFSRVETPWGISRLDEHGSWRLRPKRLELHGFRRTSGGGNPWGIAFGNWGEPFVKSNGTGISELLPSMVTTSRTASYWGGEMKIGQTRIKSMIIEFAESPHLPDDIQGDMLIAGYFAHVIDRLKWGVDGGGHRSKNMPPLLTSSHRAFRPVDIRIGPDGAIYVADWFNPIIGHYQASFRHPDRNKTHGRIWRITAKGRPLAKAPALAKMNASELCEQLKSDWRYVRYQAKRRLADLPKKQVIPAAIQWITKLNTDDAKLEHRLYEAIGVFESHEVINLPLLMRLLAAKDYRARAYATRVVGRWHDRLEAPLNLLRQSATDEHARVRLEAVVACSEIRTPESMVVAALATDRTMDRFVGYAFKQTVHALASKWRPALEQGKIRFASPVNLTHVLRAYGGKDVAAQVRALIKSSELSADGRRQLLELLARVGNSGDLQLVFDIATRDRKLLQALVPIATIHPTRPANVEQGLADLFNSKDLATRAAAIRLAGLWRQNQLVAKVESIVNSDNQVDRVRATAILSFGELAPKQSSQLRRFITTKQAAPVRLAALEAVSRNDFNNAMVDGLKLITQLKDNDDVAAALAVLMRRKGAGQAMIKVIADAPPSSDDAKRIIRWLNATGITVPELTDALLAAMDVKPGTIIAFNKAYVDQLTRQVQQHGDPVAGKKVFQSSVTGCVACHQVQEVNQLGPFAKGPELTAVGAGLQTELIIEAIIWPKRQIKEGYEAAMLMLHDGRMITGYITTKSDETTSIRDMATGKILTVNNASIDRTIKIGTVMPDGLTAFLTNKELRDLVAYLADLKVISAKPPS